MKNLRVPLPRMTFEDRYKKFLDLEASIEYRAEKRTQESIEAIDLLLLGAQRSLVNEELGRIMTATEKVSKRPGVYPK